MSILSKLLSAFRAQASARAILPSSASTPRQTTADLLKRVTLPEASWTPYAISPNLNPSPVQLKQIMHNALLGDLASQWDIFHQMQDSWPRLRKNLHELRSSVASTRWQIVPADPQTTGKPTPEAIKRADAAKFSMLSWTPAPDSDENGFEDCIYDLCEAFATGTSLQEILWERKNGLTRPRASVWVSPRQYTYTPDFKLAIRSQASSDFIFRSNNDKTQSITPNKYIIAKYKSLTGPPGSWGMLRPLAWWWGGTLWGRDWMLNYAQLFGQPLRWATYDTSADAATVAALKHMMEQLGSAGWGIFPAGTTMDFKEASKSGSDNPQTHILEMADKLCDILILGQTLTTDVSGSGSRALGEVHEQVRNERIGQLARWIADIFNYQVLPAFCRLNWGNDDFCPVMRIDNTERPDQDKLATRLQVLTNIGLKIPQAWAYEQLGIPMPQGDEAVIERQAQPEITPPVSASRPSVLGPRSTDLHPSDLIASRKAAALASAYRGAMAPVRQIILESSTQEEAMLKLSAFYADWPQERVAAVLEEALQLCAAAGASNL